jgi:hypothetical protein
LRVEGNIGKQDTIAMSPTIPLNSPRADLKCSHDSLKPENDKSRGVAH